MGREEHRRRDRESGQLIGAQVPDDGGVGDDVERFRHEGAERGDGQDEDGAVVAAAPEHGTQPAALMSRR